jgi:hypothetical protein
MSSIETDRIARSSAHRFTALRCWMWTMHLGRAARLCVKCSLLDSARSINSLKQIAPSNCQRQDHVAEDLCLRRFHVLDGIKLRIAPAPPESVLLKAICRPRASYPPQRWRPGVG